MGCVDQSDLLAHQVPRLRKTLPAADERRVHQAAGWHCWHCWHGGSTYNRQTQATSSPWLSILNCWCILLKRETTMCVIAPTDSGIKHIGDAPDMPENWCMNEPFFALCHWNSFLQCNEWKKGMTFNRPWRIICSVDMFCDTSLFLLQLILLSIYLPCVIYGFHFLY